MSTEKLNDAGASPQLHELEHYRLSVDQIEQLYNTNKLQGLTIQEAEARLAEYGENTLGEDEKISFVSIVMHQTFNAMILVLIISLVICFAIKDWISGGVIAFVVFLNISIGSYQEYKACMTMNSLNSLASPTAHVYRNGELQTIPTKLVIPGDIVALKVGDTIPADIRIFEGLNFETDEALLTGESMPVEKNHSALYETEVGVGDRLNMAYSSSVVTKGHATGIAVKTGLHTEIGEIARSLKGHKVKKEDGDATFLQRFLRSLSSVIGSFLGVTVGTPLHRKLSKLAILLFFIAVLFAIIVMASQEMKVSSEVAIYAICVAISMIPSSLVVVLTITISVGAKFMSSKNVIVRKLDSLEALGSINDICSDKTGTLTQGRMIVKTCWVPSLGVFQVEGASVPFNPTIGTISFEPYSPLSLAEKEVEESKVSLAEASQNALFKKWLMTATLANIAVVFQDEAKEWKAHGDPTEIAIQVFAHRNGYPREKLTEGDDPQYHHLNEFPFDSSIKKMTTVYANKDDPDSNYIFTKGAVERVLECCTHWYVDGKHVPLTEEDLKLIESNMSTLSSYGLRVLSFAHKTVPKNFDLHSRDEIESDLTFLGLVGIYDPPRLESRAAVKKCHGAGINVHMLTGDHPGTARAIAAEVGIVPHNLYHYSQEVVDSMIMTAQQFDGLTEQEIDNLPVLPLVIARCSPKTKVRMIEALHRRKKFCAMTGDGVNDSPSLKKADVGIAMGIAGSDIAKDAADIVLSDDNFSSIINGIEEGRRMNDNIQKFVLQLLAENVAQALYLMIGLVFKDGDGLSVFPLSPIEVLWIIVVTSCFPAMGLGVEVARPDIMEKDPKPTRESVFSWEMLFDLFSYGVWMAVCCLATFCTCIYGFGDGELGHECNQSYSSSCHYVFRARSAAFVTMTWCALILAWEVIDMRRSFFAMKKDSEAPFTQVFRDVWSNQFLFWSVIGGFVSCFPVVYIPVINKKVFMHGPIGKEWGISVAFTIAFWIGCEVYKFFKRVYYRKERVHNPEHDLERKNPFEKYVSFSRANTAVPSQ